MNQPEATTPSCEDAMNRRGIPGRRWVVGVLAGAGILAASAAPTCTEPTQLVQVTFTTVRWNFIDDSGPFWSQEMAHVAQMYGRYGAQVSGTAEEWKLIGTWGAVGSAKFPGIKPWESHDCTVDGAENSDLCMWNVGDALLFPNGEALTRYSDTPSLPATNGMYDLSVFPTCTSMTKPTDSSPYCEDSNGNPMLDVGYSTASTVNQFLLSVDAGQTITLDLTLMDYDWSSGDDLICGTGDSVLREVLTFDEKTLESLDQVVELDGGSWSGTCTVEVHLKNVGWTL